MNDDKTKLFVSHDNSNEIIIGVAAKVFAASVAPYTNADRKLIEAIARSSIVSARIFLDELESELNVKE